MEQERREHLYTQKLFPIVNNEDLLEFRVPPNPKGQLELANVYLHFMLTLPKASDDSEIAWPQNLVGPKQFSSLEVRVNGEALTRRSCAGEYWLRSYFQNMLNYSLDYQQSAFQTIGIFDFANATTASIANYSASTKAAQAVSRQGLDSHHRRYEIFMPIDSTLFYSNDLLPSNTALDLSFERTKANVSVLSTDPGKHFANTDPLVLDDCYLLLPFKKSESLFHLERNAIQRPIKINYDDYLIKRFNVPKGTRNVMMSDIVSGPLPSKIFWGMLLMDSYTGSYNHSSTRFSHMKMNKTSMFINGKLADGFPWKFSTDSVAIPFAKFLDNARQFQNAYLSRTLSPLEFLDSNFIMSATIPPDSSGSLSFEFQFDEALSKDLVLIVCSIYDKTMRIDHRRNFQIT